MPPVLQVLDRFAGAKARLDSSDASMNDVMEALHQLTTVRAVLGAKLSSGECAGLHSCCVLGSGDACAGRIACCCEL